MKTIKKLFELLNETQKEVILNSLIEIQNESTTNRQFNEIGKWLFAIDEE